MRIVYCLPFWPYLYTPWLFNELSWMRARGHHVAVVSLGAPPGATADLNDFSLADVPVLQVRLQHQSDVKLMANLFTLGFTGWKARPARSLADFRRACGLRQGLHEWATMKRVLAFIKAQKAQVIHAHWGSHNALMAADIRQAIGLPFAVRFQGGDLYRTPAPALPRIADEASALCPVSQFMADLLAGQRPVDHLPQVPQLNLDPAKVRVVHNSIPRSVLASEPVPQNEGDLVVGMSARLDPEKRHCDLLTAVARLMPKHPNLRIKLVGGGALEPALREQAKTLGIADRLEITGSLPWPKVIEAVRSLNIYVHSSEVEGCSLAVLEAQAQGLPMLLSRTGAAAQCVIENVNGHLFHAGDVDALTGHLEHLISIGPTGRQAMGQASMNHVEKHFLFDTVMMRSEAILDAVRSGLPLPLYKTDNS